MICREHETAQKFLANPHLNIVPSHYSNQPPLHLLSHSNETTSILTKLRHTGHICCHASFHRGHGLGHSPAYNKVFHSSLVFHIPGKNPLKRQIITFSIFLLFNTENAYHSSIVKECQVSKVRINTCSLLRINRKQ